MAHETVVLLIVLAVSVSGIYQLLCASVAASIAGGKNYNRAYFFILALLMLAPLNIAVALIATPERGGAGDR